MFDVYIIQSELTGRYYIGQSENAILRLQRHNAGSVSSTKNGRPWKIVRVEKVTDRTDAINRERKIKSYKGGEAFKKLIGI